MTRAEMQKLLELPLEQRVDLTQVLWESIEAEQEAGLPLSEQQRRLLDERLAYATAHPERLISWEQIEERVRAKLAEPAA